MLLGGAAAVISKLVAAFYDGYREKTGHSVGVDTADRMFSEEEGELDLALDNYLDRPCDERRIEVARELADVIFTAHGLALALSIDLDEASRLVGEANLRKLDGGRIGRFGKLEKPAGWEAPDLSGTLRPQTPTGIIEKVEREA